MRKEEAKLYYEGGEVGKVQPRDEGVRWNMTQKEVFRYEDWTVRKWNSFEGSCIMHEPCGQTMESGLLEAEPQCYQCKAPIPDELLAVWVLLNLDRIQQNSNQFRNAGGFVRS